MGFYSMKNFMLTVLTILQFSSFTSAGWLHQPYDVPPAPPPQSDRTCVEWITHYGFGSDTELNRSMAYHRAKAFDYIVSEFALLYAQILSAFLSFGKEYGFEPLMFCSNFLGFQEYNSDVSFKTIHSTQKTCREWIHAYKYRYDDYEKDNWNHADLREPEDDFIISVWAAGYARFITKKKKKNTISIDNYCIGMGLSERHQMNFISFTETTKSCKEWIELSEYENDFTVNRQKFDSHNKHFFEYLNASTQRYIDHLRLYYAPKKRGFGCASSSTTIELDDEGPQTPEVFCNRRQMTPNIRLKYDE